MDDFYKNIKDNLENRPEPPFEESAWQNMERKLDKKPWSGAGLAGWFWVLPFILGGLLLSNIFFYKELNEANGKINKLELIADTIYKTKVIYHYDTLYRERVETEYIFISNKQPQRVVYAPPTAFNHPFNSSLRSNWLNSVQSPTTFAQFKDLFEDESGIVADALTENNKLTQKVVELMASPYLQPHFLSLSPENKPEKLAYLDVQMDAKIRKRPLQKLASELQPTGFQLGVQGGFTFPQHEQVVETGGFEAGIYGAMSFSDKIKMWAEVSYYKVEFKTNEIGKSLGIPEIPPPSDEFDFIEASVNQPFYQYGLGLQYILYAKKNWSPYLGLGYTFSSMRSYEISYDFEHMSNDTELSIEEMVDRDDLIMNMFVINGGIEGNLSDRIGLQLEGYYRWNGDKKGLLITNLYGLRTKLIYNF